MRASPSLSALRLLAQMVVPWQGLPLPRCCPRFARSEARGMGQPAPRLICKAEGLTGWAHPAPLIAQARATGTHPRIGFALLSPLLRAECSPYAHLGGWGFGFSAGASPCCAGGIYRAGSDRLSASRPFNCPSARHRHTPPHRLCAPLALTACWVLPLRAFGGLGLRLLRWGFSPLRWGLLRVGEFSRWAFTRARPHWGLSG